MLQAGKEAARLRREHLASARSFAIETTLSGHSELRVMEDAHAAGFKVNLIFLGIAGPETSLARVLPAWARLALGSFLRLEGGDDNPDVTCALEC
jgi:predicted ABC-type ATPase